MKASKGRAPAGPRLTGGTARGTRLFTVPGRDVRPALARMRTSLFEVLRSRLDGARVTVPTFGFYEADGSWGIEGHGVDPDIEVIDDPALMTDGGDPQLDAAIQLMLAEIEENPYIPPHRPSPPDRSGMGVTDEDH